MGGHDHGGFGPVDPVEQFHDADAGLRIEISRRLVGDEDLRPVHESPCDRDPLLFTARQLLVQPVLLSLQADEPEGLRNHLPDDS